MSNTWTRTKIREGVHRYTSGQWTVTARPARSAVEGQTVFGQQVGSTRTRIRGYDVDRDGRTVYHADTLTAAKAYVASVQKTLKEG